MHVLQLEIFWLHKIHLFIEFSIAAYVPIFIYKKIKNNWFNLKIDYVAIYIDI